MTGDVTSTLSNLPSTTTSSTSGGSSTSAAVSTRSRTSPNAQPQILVPAGIFGDIVGGLASTIGETAGGWFGNKELGRTLGTAAGPLIKYFSPFEVYAPSVAPQSTGPQAAPPAGPDEAVVVVPAGFLSGVLGGIGGKLLGGVVGGLFGNKDLGSTIGGAAGGAIGSFFGPFEVVPPSLVPASAGPGGSSSSDDALVVVPAGFFGNLLGATAGAIGNLIGGKRGQEIGDIAGSLAKQLLPWSVLPPEVTPQSAGPDGQQKAGEELVVVPAFFLGNVLKNYGDLITCFPRDLLNAHKPTIADVKNADIAPFQAVPAALAPAAAGGAPTAPEDTLMFVPAGLFGSLLSGLGSTLGNAVGGLFGHAQTGEAIGGIVGQVGNLLPFSVVPR